MTVVSKTDRLWRFLAARAAESSTWQGIAFLLSFTGLYTMADFDLTGATAAGALISAIIKAFLPDRLDGAE